MKISGRARSFDISRFLFASFAGFLGGHLANYSVILYAQDVWNSDMLAGVGFSLCFGIPLILGWFGGAWCDSHSPQKIAQMAHVSFLVSISLLGVTPFVAAEVNRYVFLLGAVFAGIGWAVLAPARMALLGRLAENKQAKLGVIFNILVMLGFGAAPPLLAVCKKYGGWTMVHGTGFGFFILSIVSLYGLKAVGLGHQSSALDRIRQGVIYVARTPILKETIVFSLIIFLAMGPVQVMLPRFATQILHLTELRRGLFLGAMAVALLIGGGISLGIAKKFGFGKTILSAGLLCATSLVALGAGAGVELSVLFLLLSGIGAGLSISLVVALLQSESKPEYRGRLMSLYTITSQAIPAFSGLLSGFVLVTIPVNRALVGAGGMLSLFLLVLFFTLKGLRTYRGHDPD